MMVPFGHALSFAAALFVLGLTCVLLRRQVMTAPVGLLAQALHDRPGAHAAIVQLNTGTTEQIVDVVQMDETRQTRP